MTTNGQYLPLPEAAGAQPRTLWIESLPLEDSTVLSHVPIGYQTWGQLNEAGDNVVVICHALTGSSDVQAWWPGITGPGLAIDTNRFFVVCANVLGSPYGSASPLTENPDTGRAYGSDFPPVTIRDTVSAHRRLLESLGVRKVIAAIGASMGGMQALEWAFHPDLVHSVVPVAVGGRHSAWCIAWSEAQRQAIFADPNWREGRYGPESPPAAGLAAARMAAMISYRSHQEFVSRFGREIMPPGNENESAKFSAESYLLHQGQKLVSRFDANCYVHLTRQMDSHDVSRGRGEYLDVLRSVRLPALVIGITSDILYPLAEQQELAETMPNATLAVVDSPSGHDSFLIETEKMSRLVRDWITQQAGVLRQVGGQMPADGQASAAGQETPLSDQSSPAGREENADGRSEADEVEKGGKNVRSGVRKQRGSARRCSGNA